MPSKYKDAIERQGAFGNLFVQYMGCPRGPVGRMGWAAEALVLLVSFSIL